MRTYFVGRAWPEMPCKFEQPGVSTRSIDRSTSSAVRPQAERYSALGGLLYLRVTAVHACRHCLSSLLPCELQQYRTCRIRTPIQRPGAVLEATIRNG